MFLLHTQRKLFCGFLIHKIITVKICSVHFSFFLFYSHFIYILKTYKMDESILAKDTFLCPDNTPLLSIEKGFLITAHYVRIYQCEFVFQMTSYDFKTQQYTHFAE